MSRAAGEISPSFLKVRQDRRWASLVTLGAVALTLVPYLWGWHLEGTRPALGWFSGYTFDTPDQCVYLSWIRQAADGGFFQRNLFTTDPQIGHQFNIFFVALGWFSRVLHSSPILIYHLARLILAMAFLRALWWLIEILLLESKTRRVAFLIACFSAGVGWIPVLWEAGGTVDAWQPEAIIFLSIYLFPLFIVSLLLMVAIIGWLLVAERTQNTRYAVYAGLCGLLLGNIHTYDAVTLTAVWGVYLIVRTVAERHFDARAWVHGLIAAGLTAISTGYIAYLLKTEAVFAQRAAVQTVSPLPHMYLLGYGGVLILAGFGVRFLQRELPRDAAMTSDTQVDMESGRGVTSSSATALLLIWATMNFLAIYLPVPFQRKMIMGEHIPLAMLAGLGLCWLLRRLQGRAWTGAVARVIVVLSLTNLRFLQRDIEQFREKNKFVRSHLYAGEVQSLEWLKEYAPPDVPIQPLPWVIADAGDIRVDDISVACFAPGLTGHPVNAGHPAETPHFEKAIQQWVRFILPTTPDEWRIDLLRRSGSRYVLSSQKHDETSVELVGRTLLSTFRNNPPPYLHRIPEASNDDADVYEVVLP